MTPGGSAGSYDFDFTIAIPAGTEVSVNLEANDLSGNQTQRDYALQSTSQSSIDAILPADGAQFISDGSVIDLQLAARVSDIEMIKVRQWMCAIPKRESFTASRLRDFYEHNLTASKNVIKASCLANSATSIVKRDTSSYIVDLMVNYAEQLELNDVLDTFIKLTENDELN